MNLMELTGVIESFIGTFTANIIVLVFVAYVLKKKMKNSMIGGMI